jgi:hypothetical protein
VAIPANGNAKYDEHKYDEHKYDEHRYDEDLCNRTKIVHLLPAASMEPGAAMPVPWS